MGNPYIHAPGLALQIGASIWIGAPFLVLLTALSAYLFVSMVHIEIRRRELRDILERLGYRGRAALSTNAGGGDV